MSSLPSVIGALVLPDGGRGRISRYKYVVTVPNEVYGDSTRPSQIQATLSSTDNHLISTKMSEILVGEYLFRRLKQIGVQTIFGVPGGKSRMTRPWSPVAFSSAYFREGRTKH